MRCRLSVLAGSVGRSIALDAAPAAVGQGRGALIEGPNRNDWVRRGGLGIKEGAVVATSRTVYMGQGFEGISEAATRNQVMSRAIDHLMP